MPYKRNIFWVKLVCLAILKIFYPQLSQVKRKKACFPFSSSGLLAEHKKVGSGRPLKKGGLSCFPDFPYKEDTCSPEHQLLTGDKYILKPKPMWSHHYFGWGQTDKEGSFLRRIPYCLEVHNPLYGIKQKNNKLSFLYPLSICWKDQHWVDIGSSLLSLDRWGKATLCQGKCHPRQELRDDFFLLRAGLNGRKKSLPFPSLARNQGRVSAFPDPLCSVSHRGIWRMSGETRENKGSGKHMSKTSPNGSQIPSVCGIYKRGPGFLRFPGPIPLGKLRQ